MSSKFQAKVKKRKEKDFENMFGSAVDDELLDEDFLTLDESASKDLVYHAEDDLLDPQELSFKYSESQDFSAETPSYFSDEELLGDRLNSFQNGEEVTKEEESENLRKVPPGASIRPPARKNNKALNDAAEESSLSHKMLAKAVNQKKTLHKTATKPSENKPVLSATGIGTYFYLSMEVKNALKLRHILDPDRTMSEHVETALRIYLKNELLMLGDVDGGK